MSKLHTKDIHNCILGQTKDLEQEMYAEEKNAFSFASDFSIAR